jgi:hypothetical protein
MRRELIGLIALATLIAAPLTADAATLEKPKTESAQLFLGPTVIGPNYKVRPHVRSDGMMRLFDVETPYGNFQFAGVEFTKMRLRELDAVAALEKMSQSDAFMNALGRAAFAPIQFGANLITNPVDTINRSMSGVANMFDRGVAGLANTRSDRDTLAESLLGVSDTQRQLAVELGVDPYTDFPPLAERLKQMASAMAGGGLPVKAGLALIPGGVGIAVSSVSSVDSAKDSLRTKTAAQLIAETHSILQSLSVPDESIERLVENRNYTPADLIIMARALAKLGATNSAAFVDDAAKAATRDFAFYERRLAELMAARSAQLGGLASFTTVSGHLVNIGRNGNVIAVYPLDDLSWSKVPQRAITTATAELRRERPRDHPVFATTGAVTPMARGEMKKLGWQIVELKPLP